MSAWLPLLGAPLEAGPLPTFAVAFAISPGIPALLALVMERRLLRGKREFVAFFYGDPLLALAAAAGIALCGPAPAGPVAVVATGWVPLAAMGCWLGFGLWQWWAELHAGLYRREQAWAPTKIWHQVVVYPALGYLVTAPVSAGFAAPTGISGSTAKIFMAGCVITWIAANIYDRHHPKLGHPPYDWRHLRPHPTPWGTASASLRADAALPSRTEAFSKFRTTRRDSPPKPLPETDTPGAGPRNSTSNPSPSGS
ncbi:hypothetical protein P8A22_37930 (plasmid) [Streptomyces laculatispora]|uniref:Uncharacterized protein n=1 Tax=Streptomyces laculatispora TaxID=887464 RepID=A0ABY9IFK5_9ACTN|nr:hypothetical protein [Streptomyces laculatispora]WLQ45610.1 hypothetical protein P8A22_37930 [Streptomyces laculatispora]